MKKSLDAIVEQALENIKNDRQETESLLTELKEDTSVSRERYADSGSTAAKFGETLQRSNEQLVKIINLKKKGTAETLNAKPTTIKTIPKTAPVFASIKFVEITSKFVDPVNPKIREQP